MLGLQEKSSSAGDADERNEQSQSGSRPRTDEEAMGSPNLSRPNSGSNNADTPHEDDEKDYTVTWDGDEDPEDPKTMSRPRKWLIVIIISSTSFCVTCNSSIYTTTYTQIEPRFHNGREVSTLGLSTFVFGLM